MYDFKVLCTKKASGVRHNFRYVHHRMPKNEETPLNLNWTNSNVGITLTYQYAKNIVIRFESNFTLMMPKFMEPYLGVIGMPIKMYSSNYKVAQ